MDLTFARLDYEDVDARATWEVVSRAHVIGRVSEYGPRSYGVTGAGMGVPTPAGRFNSLDDAGMALIGARATCPGIRVQPSGLTRMEEDVLRAESWFVTEPEPGRRDVKAAEMNISPTQYLQILRHLRTSPFAAALDPATVARLQQRHVAAMTRQDRLRRDRDPLAAAS